MGDTKETKKDPHADLIATLKNKHGAIAVLVASAQLFAFRTPTLDEWEDFEHSIRPKDARVGPARRQLCLETLVYPEGDDGVARLRELFQRSPRAATMIGEELADLADAGIEVVVKKD